MKFVLDISYTRSKSEWIRIFENLSKLWEILEETTFLQIFMCNFKYIFPSCVLNVFEIQLNLEKLKVNYSKWYFFMKYSKYIRYLKLIKIIKFAIIEFELSAWRDDFSIIFWIKSKYLNESSYRTNHLEK